ncbi:hypothetical protein H0H87_000636 [Tephrocybe sp. NHM501043]|nr:hypothetical protein H0H87_000636 [Tephrocybe sp. NHM501043]
MVLDLSGSKCVAPICPATNEGVSDLLIPKVMQIPAVTDGGKSIKFPATNLVSVNFTIPKTLPSGQYLVRMESIALHEAASVGGAQFYIGCGQINVTGGGKGKPGPLVAIPGVYTGHVRCTPAN